MPYFVYIIKSSLTGSHYFGHCKDLDIRLRRHNTGKVRSTKAKQPWFLHYSEEYATKSEAYKRELFFKSFQGRVWLKSKKII